MSGIRRMDLALLLSHFHKLIISLDDSSSFLQFIYYFYFFIFALCCCWSFLHVNHCIPFQVWFTSFFWRRVLPFAFVFGFKWNFIVAKSIFFIFVFLAQIHFMVSQLSYWFKRRQMKAYSLSPVIDVKQKKKSKQNMKRLKSMQEI